MKKQPKNKYSWVMLHETIHRKTGLSRTECAVIIRQMLDEMIDSLSRGENVILFGLGKFIVYKKRVACGIKGREKIYPELNCVFFRPGTKLKKLVSKLDERKKADDQT